MSGAKITLLPEGMKKGFLTFIKELPIETCSNKRTRFVLVRCDCGKDKKIRFLNFVHSNTFSCGCKRSQMRKKNPFRDAQIERSKEEIDLEFITKKEIEKKKWSKISELEEMAFQGMIRADFLHLKTRQALYNESTGC